MLLIERTVFCKRLFLRFIQVKQCTAEYIYRAITKLLVQEIGAPKANLIEFATDNALVTTGEQGGVQAMLSEDCSTLFVLGCLCQYPRYFSFSSLFSLQAAVSFEVFFVVVVVELYLSLFFVVMGGQFSLKTFIDMIVLYLFLPVSR